MVNKPNLYKYINSKIKEKMADINEKSITKLDEAKIDIFNIYDKLKDEEIRLRTLL